MARSVEILPYLVAQVWPAVADITSPIRQRVYEVADLGGEGMMLPIPSHLHPQHLSCRLGRLQCVQHGQNRSRPNAGAKQHDWALPRLNNEVSAGRAHIEGISHSNMIVQVGSSRSIRLDLHADAIAFR